MGIDRFECTAPGQPSPMTTEPQADDGSCLVRITAGGPVLVQGPVRIEMPDGSTVASDRFLVAICTCKRSKTYPLCDTSHRTRRRTSSAD